MSYMLYIYDEYRAFEDLHLFRSPFSRLQLLLPLGYAPLGATAEASGRLIVELSIEQGQGGSLRNKELRGAF